jgi:hypothetical protein
MLLSTKIGHRFPFLLRLIFSLARNYFFARGVLRKAIFCCLPLALLSENLSQKHLKCIELLQQVTHNTNKNSIEAPHLQPLYSRGHTERLCSEPVLQGLVRAVGNVVLQLLLLALHEHHLHPQLCQLVLPAESVPTTRRRRRSTGAGGTNISFLNWVGQPPLRGCSSGSWWRWRQSQTS